MRQLVVRPKNVDRTLYWYDGENDVVEIAKELAYAGLNTSVSFGMSGLTYLKLNGEKVDRRSWIADDGDIFSEDQLDELFDVVESR